MRSHLRSQCLAFSHHVVHRLQIQLQMPNCNKKPGRGWAKALALQTNACLSCWALKRGTAADLVSLNKASRGLKSAHLCTIRCDPFGSLRWWMIRLHLS
jgi:hypothetical protein